MVNIEGALFPRDHLLRKMNKTIYFSFVAETCRPLYCEDNATPTLTYHAVQNTALWLPVQNSLGKAIR
jgi:hypothetical protein